MAFDYGKVKALESQVTPARYDYAQEKVDGSHFRFGVLNGRLWVMSKTSNLLLEPHRSNAQFKKAIDSVLRIHEEGPIRDGLTFFCEAVVRNKQNKLTYTNPPELGFVVFDVCDRGVFADPYTASQMTMRYVPGAMYLPAIPPDSSPERESVLGGMREGIVLKMVKRTLNNNANSIAKRVTSGFKEGTFSAKDDIWNAGKEFATPARFDKAIQYLRDSGQLTGTKKDIGKLMSRLNRDLEEEHRREIERLLWPKIWKLVARNASQGAVEYFMAHTREEDGGSDGV